jgi:hypothetical protein
MATNQITKVSEEVERRTTVTVHKYSINGKKFTITDYDNQDAITGDYERDIEVEGELTDEEREIIDEFEIELLELDIGEDLHTYKRDV